MSIWKKLLPPPAAGGGAAFESHVGTFSTGTGSSNIAVTGVGFTPKLVIFLSQGITATTDSESATHSRFMIGATDGAAQLAIAQFDEEAAATADSYRTVRDDACVVVLEDTSVERGRLAYSSFDSDGFTLSVTDTFSTDTAIHYIALGGSSLNVGMGMITLANSETGVAHDVTSLSFQPTGVIFPVGHDLGVSAFNAIGATGARYTTGLADGTNQACAAIQSTDNATSYSANNRFSNAHIVQFPGTGVTQTGAFTSFLSNGFRITTTTSSAGTGHIPWIAIGGVSCKVGDVTLANNTTAFAETGVGFQPSAGFFICSGQTAYNGVNLDSTADNRYSIGVIDSALNRRSISWYGDDASDPMAIRIAQETDSVIILHDSAGVDGLLDINSWDSDGFTAQMDNATSVPALVPYLVIG